MEFIKRKKAKGLLDLKGKVEPSFSLTELLKRRGQDVPYR